MSPVSPSPCIRARLRDTHQLTRSTRARGTATPSLRTRNLQSVFGFPPCEVQAVLGRFDFSIGGRRGDDRGGGGVVAVVVGVYSVDGALTNDRIRNGRFLAVGRWCTR